MIREILTLMFFLLTFFIGCSTQKQIESSYNYEMKFLNEIFYDFIKNCICEESWNIPIFLTSNFITFEENIADEIKSNTEFYLKQIQDTSFREAMKNLTDNVKVPTYLNIDLITNKGTYQIYDDRLFKNQGLLISISNPAFNIIKTRACVFYNVYSVFNKKKYGIAYFKLIDGKWFYYKKYLISY